MGMARSGRAVPVASTIPEEDAEKSKSESAGNPLYDIIERMNGTGTAV